MTADRLLAVVADLAAQHTTNGAPMAAIPEMPEWMRERATDTEQAIAGGTAPTPRPDSADSIRARIEELTRGEWPAAIDQQPTDEHGAAR